MVATITPVSDLSTALGADPGLERLYDNVQAVVPGVTLSLIKLAAWNTIEEFYLRSTVQRQAVYWQLTSGETTIDFNPFDETWLVAWILEFDGLHNVEISQPAVLRDLTFPTPSTARNGRALLSLRPISMDVNFPPDLWVQWFDVILDGTMGRLYGQPAKPWSAPQLALFHGQKFRGGIRRARATADKGFTNGAGRWRFPYFSGGRRKS